MQWLLFSELIKNSKSKTKPDVFISNKIDEIDFPLKHISFIKKNINEFLFESFNNVVDFQKRTQTEQEDLYNDFGTEKTIEIPFGEQKIEINFKKNKKECNLLKYEPHLDFDNKILTDEFINEINKYYILISLTFAVSLDHSFNFIKQNKEKYNINCRFVSNEILSFWINNFKRDFCYFNEIDLNETKVIEEREIEFGIIQVFFNYYKKQIFDTSEYTGIQHKILDRIINDKSNYKWYIIFGVAIWDKIKDKFKNSNESAIDGIHRIKKLNLKIIDNIFDELINQT